MASREPRERLPRPTGMHIDEILRDQDGVVGRKQAIEAGMTGAGIAWRLSTGTWIRVAPEVFRSAAHPETDRSRLRTHALWLGDDATLIGVGAAWWLRMVDDPPACFRFAVPAVRRVRSRGEARVLRRDLAEDERMTVGGVPVTTRAVTVLDAVAELGVTAGADLMDRVLLRGRVSQEALLDAYRAGMGRRGWSTAARLLALAAGGARFEAERRLHRQLRLAGVTGWTAELPVHLPGYGDALLDLAFAECRVVVEVDGWAYHRDLDAFRRDRSRQNALVLAGWTVVRVTWHDLVERPEQVVAWILTALDGRVAG